MGVRGLYSCLKAYAVPVYPEEEEALTVGIDTYALFYKFKENLEDLFVFVKSLQCGKHSVLFVLDGVPPPEKQEELALRRAQRKEAAQQAKALRTILHDAAPEELTSDARDVLQNRIKQYDDEAWVVYKELRDRFVEKAMNLGYPILFSEGEADTDLLHMALQDKIQVVLANDMDYFVGGVERLWIVHKDVEGLREFRRSAISRAMSLSSTAWKDIAILAGYEKTPHLRRLRTTAAISYLQMYGSLERLFERKKELLGENSIEEFLTARHFFE
jgi:5'-3' exonuclease